MPSHCASSQPSNRCIELHAPRAKDFREFVKLRKLVDTSEGNLSLHLQTLEQSGYLTIEKDFADNKPRTRVKLSREGRLAYGQYIEFLREIVAGYRQN